MKSNKNNDGDEMRITWTAAASIAGGLEQEFIGMGTIMLAR